jgi:hypothetical protein
MRILVILAGLALGVGLFATAPARAATVGCACNKIGASPVCTATVEACNRSGGVCLWTCAYEPPKMAKAKKKKKM